MVESIRHHVQSEKLAHGEVPRELTETEEAEIKAFGAESLSVPVSVAGPPLP